MHKEVIMSLLCSSPIARERGSWESERSKMQAKYDMLGKKQNSETKRRTPSGDRNRVEVSVPGSLASCSGGCSGRGGRSVFAG